MNEKKTALVPPVSNTQQLQDSTPPVQESIEGRKTNKSLIIGFIILFLLTLGVVGTFVYQNYRRESQQIDSNQTSPINIKNDEKPNVTDKYCEYKNQQIMKGKTYSYDDYCNICLCMDTVKALVCTGRTCDSDHFPEYENWNDYIDNKQVAFKYPTGWKVSVETSSESLTQTNPEQKTFIYKITSQQGDYLAYFKPDIPGGVDILKECENIKTDPYRNNNVFKETTENGKYTRRIFSRLMNDKGEYIICGDVGLGRIKYVSNSSDALDTEILHYMDLITFSIDTPKSPGTVFIL